MKDYIIQDLTYIKNKKSKFIEGAILAHKRFVFAYGVSKEKELLLLLMYVQFKIEKIH